MMHKRCMLSYYTQRRIVSVRNLIRIGSSWVNQFFYASIAARKASNYLRKVKLPDGKFSSEPDEDPQVVTGSHDTIIKFWGLRQCFASAPADNIKKFKLPKGEFMHNMLSQQKTNINVMAVNVDGVMTTAGLLDSEASVYALSYDISGSRLVTCEADKTIKAWKKDETAILSTLATCKKGSQGLKVFTNRESMKNPNGRCNSNCCRV